METFAVVVLVAVVGVGVAAAASASSRKPIRSAWGAAASTLGLGFEPGDFFSYPEIHGDIRGHAVKVSTLTRGEDSTRHTRYGITYRSALGLGLRIRERTVLSSVQRLFGKQDLTFGDTGFEERLVVTASSPEAVVALLGPERRRALRDFYAFFPGAVIDDTTLTWETEGVDGGRERLVENVRGLVKMAQDLEQWVRGTGARPRPEVGGTTAEIRDPAPDPKRLPPETVLAAASDDERAPSVPSDELLDPGWIPPRLSEGDEDDATDADADAVSRPPEPIPDGDQAAPRLQIAANHAVLETSRQPDGTVSAERDPIPAPPAPPSSAAAEAPRRDAPIHPRDVSQILFGARLMGDELERQFIERFEGRRVLWAGTLRSVGTYPFDHIFGSERGARATFEIAELSDVYGARQVRAVVRVPESTAKRLIMRVGQRLLFEGTLYRCEAFMRTLYLEDGSVPESAAPADGRPTARPTRAGPARRSAS